MSQTRYPLTQTVPPWILRVRSLSGIQADLDAVSSSEKGRVFLLSGAKMGTVEQMFSEFARGMRFPGYFGHNSAAFQDCLTDMAWEEFDRAIIVIDEADRVLADFPDDLQWLWDSLSDVCEYWNKPIEEGKAWDRPAIPFHIVLSKLPAG